MLEGELRTVAVPPVEELEGWKERWTWAAVRMTGGSEEAAWRAALAVECPGLGWDTDCYANPKPFDSCVFGAAPVGGTEAASDTSSFGGRPRFHTPIHRGPPPHRAPHAKHGGSGSAGPHRPPTQRPTSNASSRPAHGAGGANPRPARPTARPHATPGKAGWMGREATKRPGSAAVPHA